MKNKILSQLLVFFLLLSSCAQNVYAGMFDIPGIPGTGTFGFEDDEIGGYAVEGFDAIAEDIGLNKDSLMESVDAFNVAQRKKPAPYVSISFDPPNPVPGEKVTATAMVSGFMNDYNSLYFTWYLKNKKCTDKINDEDDYEYNEDCDLDEDGEVDIEDFKIKAARIMAGNDFDWKEAHEERNAYDSSVPDDDDGYDAPAGGADQVGKSGEQCFLHDFHGGYEWHYASCFHLFPNTKHGDDYDSREVPDDADKLGDGKFGREEEFFWHTNPYAKDTLGSGQNDEANALGLGQETFTFSYADGDQLGVVVEGVSTEPTEQFTPAYRTMWAFLNNKCEFDRCNMDHLQCSENEETPVEDGEEGETMDCSGRTSNCPGGVFSECCSTESPVIMNINKECVANNFVDPTTGGGATEKLDLYLEYSPQNPINDSSGEDAGDELVFSADVTNATNKNYIEYTWEVYTGDDISTDDWGEPFSKSELSGVTQTSGLNLKDFKFRMNFSEGTLARYLRVKVTAKENLGLTHPREGHTDAIITVNSANDRLSVYSAEINWSEDNSSVPPALFVPDSGKKERCLIDDDGNKLPATDVDGTEKPAGICAVAKNEIIAVRIGGYNPATGEHDKYSDYYWTVDGAPFQCVGGTAFEGCVDGGQSYITYIPVTKKVGETFSVNLSGINNETGDKFNLTRLFKVTDPTVKIQCGPECEQLLLGKYTDLDGGKYEDKSDTEFQAKTGYDLELVPEFSEVFTIEDQNKFEWSVNGSTISVENATDYGYGIETTTNSLLLPAKEYGSYYNVKLSGLYVPSGATRKALNYWWGLTYNDFYEKSVEKSVRIEMVKNTTTTQTTGSKKIFATVAIGIPPYLTFLFRLSLTGFVIILALKIIFFLLLRPRKYEL